jgi:hypothetical protein
MNPDWNNQVKVALSNGNTGDFHRAIAVARHLFDAGKWPNHTETTVVISNPHNVHYELACHSKEPQLGSDYHFISYRQ